jgi:dUTP pyrophosphatase
MFFLKNFGVLVLFFIEVYMKIEKFVFTIAVCAAIIIVPCTNVCYAGRSKQIEVHKNELIKHKSPKIKDSRIKAKFKKIKESAKKPYYGTKGSAGADLSACVEQDVEITPGEIAVIPTSVAVEIPEHHFGMICSRSGLAKNGITLANAPGIIDSDYRGEVKVILINRSKTPFVVKDGMRLAQLIILPFTDIEWVKSETLSETGRGSGGFGSTGLQ